MFGPSPATHKQLYDSSMIMFKVLKGVFGTIPVCPIQVWMSYRTYRSVRYRYWCRTATGTGTGTDFGTYTGGIWTDSVRYFTAVLADSYANPIQSFRFWSGRKSKYHLCISIQVFCAKSDVEMVLGSFVCWCDSALFSTKVLPVRKFNSSLAY